MIGQSISHYKILGKLGEGGMGVVYRAHDTALDRDVALKFLPSELTKDPGAKERFIHEAKAASALEHPNICAVHEIGEYEGQMFIAMGYYEGMSLSDMIKQKQLDLDQAATIAIQIAEGLQAAHESGIVHRDIKCSNIIVTDKGQVKILDFGLAYKSGLSKLTRTGATVGTASYMSPEQARGEKIDHRSDLWSLGVVLYEMVTRKLPFRGEHEMAMLYSVVHEAPEPVETLVPEASPELVHIIRRALEKDPADRYQSAADMLIDLRRLKKDTSRTGFKPVTGAERDMSSRRMNLIISAGVILLLCIVAYVYFHTRGVEINPDFTQRTLDIPLNISTPAISPDGKYLVFTGQDAKKPFQLYIISISGGEPHQFTQETNLPGMACPNISPDGSRIVYTRGPEYDLCVVPFIGGTSTEISTGSEAKWSHDGQRIGYVLYPSGNSEFPRSRSGMSEFWTINPDGTDKRLEFVDSTGAKFVPAGNSFAWSPDDRKIAWVRGLPQGYSEIILLDLQTHKTSTLTHDSTGKNEICWAPNDQIIYSSESMGGVNLWTVSSRGGTPVQITKGGNQYFDFPSISQDGRYLAFIQWSFIGHLHLARLDGSHQNSEIASAERIFHTPLISPDGRFITYVTGSEYGSGSHIFVIGRDGSNRRQLTSGETENGSPHWSPDGKYIAFNSRGKFQPDDSTKIYVLNFEKAEAPRFVTAGFNRGWDDSISLNVWYRNRSWTAYLDGRPPKQFSDDSTLARPVLKNMYVLFLNHYPRGDKTWKACRKIDWDGHNPLKSWTVWTGDIQGIVPERGLFVFKNPEELLRISFTDGKQEIVPATFPGISHDEFAVNLTSDGREMCYHTLEPVGRIMVIENPFK